MKNNQNMINKKVLRDLISLILELKKNDGEYGKHDITSKGETVSIGPYEYSDITNRLLECIYNSGLLFPFNWTNWQEEAERICGDSELINQIDLMTVRKLLTLNVRKERFCEGYFASVCEKGIILLLLKRVEALFDEGEIEVG